MTMQQRAIEPRTHERYGCGGRAIATHTCTPSCTHAGRDPKLVYSDQVSWPRFPHHDATGRVITRDHHEEESQR